jgi:hypothetical protein
MYTSPSPNEQPTVTGVVTVTTRPVVHPGVLRRFVASSACRLFLNVIAYVCKLNSFRAEWSHACAQVHSFLEPQPVRPAKSAE